MEIGTFILGTITGILLTVVAGFLLLAIDKMQNLKEKIKKVEEFEKKNEVKT